MIIKEDPDYVLFRKDDNSFLHLSYNDDDAITFVITNDNIMYGDVETHSNMVISIILDNIKSFGNEYIENDYDMERVDLMISDFSLFFKHIKVKGSINDIKKMCQRTLNFIKTIEPDYLYNLQYMKRQTFYQANSIVNPILGRLWKNSKVISFWQGQALVVPHLQKIKILLKEMNINIEECIFNDHPYDELKTYEEYFGKVDKKASDKVDQKFSNAPIHALPPEKKKKALQDLGVKPKFRDFKDFYYKHQGD